MNLLNKTQKLAETAATISETLKVLEPERKKSVEVLVETEPPAALFDPTENPSSIFGSDTKPSSDPHLDQLNFENNILKQQLQILSQQSLNLACNIPEHALLISRNKDLEENITKLKLMLSSAQDQNAILSSKVSTLQAQHHSTDSLKSELRGLQDQNLVLKDENRKLMQRESQLLTRISQELSPAISYELTPLIENQIQWISDQRKAYRITHNKSSFTAFSAQLDRMIMACQSLIRSAERVESEEVAEMIKIALDIIKMTSQELCSSFVEADELEKKVDALRQECSNARDDAQKELLKLHHQLDTTSDKSLEEKYEQLKLDYEAAQSVIVELQSASPTSSPGLKKQVQSLTLKNNQLESHIMNLEATIAQWKQENEGLRDTLMESSELTKRIMLLEQQLADERLETLKAQETAKSIAAEPLIKTETFHDLEQEIDKRLQLTDEPKIETFIEFLKSSEDTSHQLKALAATMQTYVAELEQSKIVISDLKTLNEQQKEKMQLRETAWLEKVKEFQGKLDQSNKRISEQGRLLQDYEHQFINICAYVDEKKDGKQHPFEFNNLFVKKLHQFQQLSQQLQHAHHQLNASQEALTIANNNSQAKEKAIEILTLKGQELRDHTFELERLLTDYTQRIQSLESSLEETRLSKQKLYQKQEKLAVLFKQMMV